MKTYMVIYYYYYIYIHFFIFLIRGNNNNLIIIIRAATVRFRSFPAPAVTGNRYTRVGTSRARDDSCEDKIVFFFFLMN